MVNEIKVEIKKGKSLLKKELVLIAKESIKNFDNGKKELEKELGELRKEMDSIFFFVKDKNRIVSFGLLKPVKIDYLGKIYNILGIGNIIAIEKKKGYGAILMKEMLKYLKRKGKTGLGFTGDRVAKFYEKVGLVAEKKLRNRFFYDYGNSKTNKKEKGWWGIYYEGKDNFVKKVLVTKSVVKIPCMHW